MLRTGLLHSKESTHEIIEAIRINYNYCRKHSKLGMKPAEAAGINLNLGEADKGTELLLRQAAIHAKESRAEPYLKGIGTRISNLKIVNESDCIIAIPKAWMDKRVWREINDILRVQWFNWLSNGKQSCWIKMQDRC